MEKGKEEMRKLSLTILFLFIPCMAFATSSRVLPTSYNEKTYCASGCDYSSLATWEAATDIDLVTATKGEVLTCSSGVYNDSVILDESTTDSSYFRVIRAASGARGTPTSGVRFEITSPINAVVLLEEYACIQDIAAKVTTTTNAWRCFRSGSSYTKFIGCTAYDSGVNTTTNGAGFFIDGNAGTTVGQLVVNCYALNCQSSGYGGGIIAYAYVNVTAYIYNCTVKNSAPYGISSVSITADRTVVANVKNCIANGNTSNFVTRKDAGSATMNQTTNTASAVTFAADGYHLDASDTVAIGNGTDLSGDGTFAFDDDIDGETRGTFDIGADEYVTTATRNRLILIN